MYWITGSIESVGFKNVDVVKHGMFILKLCLLEREVEGLLMTV